MAVNTKFLSSLASNCNFASNATLNHLVGTSTPPAPSVPTPTTMTNSPLDHITPPTPTSTSLGISTGMSLFERISVPTTTLTASGISTTAPSTPQLQTNPFSNTPPAPSTSQYGTLEAPQLPPILFANLPPTPPTPPYPPQQQQSPAIPHWTNPTLAT